MHIFTSAHLRTCTHLDMHIILIPAQLHIRTYPDMHIFACQGSKAEGILPFQSVQAAKVCTCCRKRRWGSPEKDLEPCVKHFLGSVFTRSRATFPHIAWTCWSVWNQDHQQKNISKLFLVELCFRFYATHKTCLLFLQLCGPILRCFAQNRLSLRKTLCSLVTLIREEVSPLPVMVGSLDWQLKCHCKAYVPEASTGVPAMDTQRPGLQSCALHQSVVSKSLNVYKWSQLSIKELVHFSRPSRQLYPETAEGQAFSKTCSPQMKAVWLFCLHLLNYVFCCANLLLP